MLLYLYYLNLLKILTQTVVFLLLLLSFFVVVVVVFFFCVHQKAKLGVEPSLYRLQWHWCSVLHALICWCNCSENLKSKEVQLPAASCFGPDCHTKNLLLLFCFLFLFCQKTPLSFKTWSFQIVFSDKNHAKQRKTNSLSPSYDHISFVVFVSFYPTHALWISDVDNDFF